MKQQIILAGGGKDYNWANDHVFVKASSDLTHGSVTVVEDTLKPGFHLARHYHKNVNHRKFFENRMRSG